MKSYPSVFHTCTSNFRPMIGFVEPNKFDEASNRVPPTSQWWWSRNRLTQAKPASDWKAAPERKRWQSRSRSRKKREQPNDLARAREKSPVGGISNTVGRGSGNAVHFWRTLQHQAAKSYMSQRTARQRSQPHTSQEAAPTAFEILRGGEGTADWDSVASNRSTGSCFSNSNKIISSNNSNWEMRAR